MSDIVHDLGRIWCRTFDQKAFLSGEINFVLHELEEKLEDHEVDNLFKTIENITDIKDTQIGKFKDDVQNILPETNEKLDRALELCNKFHALEESIKEDQTIEEARKKRKISWEKFIDNITTTYSELNSTYESKEEELKKNYQALEEQLSL